MPSHTDAHRNCCIQGADGEMGAIYAYTFNHARGIWSFSQKLTSEAWDRSPFDVFGQAVRVTPPLPFFGGID